MQYPLCAVLQVVLGVYLLPFKAIQDNEEASAQE